MVHDVAQLRVAANYRRDRAAATMVKETVTMKTKRREMAVGWLETECSEVQSR
jgi:hypothetical protein